MNILTAKRKIEDAGFRFGSSRTIDLPSGRSEIAGAYRGATSIFMTAENDACTSFTVYNNTAWPPYEAEFKTLAGALKAAA